MFAVLSASSSGANTVVAAVAGKRILLTSCVGIALTDVNGTWKSGSTAISGAIPFGTTGGYCAPLAPLKQDGNPQGYLQTERGEALVLSLSAGVLVAGHLTYELIN